MTMINFALFLYFMSVVAVALDFVRSETVSRVGLYVFALLVSLFWGRSGASVQCLGCVVHRHSDPIQRWISTFDDDDQLCALPVLHERRSGRSRLRPIRKSQQGWPVFFRTPGKSVLGRLSGDLQF